MIVQVEARGVVIVQVEARGVCSDTENLQSIHSVLPMSMLATLYRLKNKKNFIINF